MSKRTPLEEHIKGLFDQYEPEVPEYMWERIHQQGERRPVTYIFGLNKTASLVILLGIGIMCTLGWYGWSSYNNRSEEKSSTSNSTGVIKSKELPPIKTEISNKASVATSNEHRISDNQTNVSSSELASVEIKPLYSIVSNKKVDNSKVAGGDWEDAIMTNTNIPKKIKSSSAKKVKIQVAITDESIPMTTQDASLQQEITEKELTAPSESIISTLSMAKGLPQNVIQKIPANLTIPCPASPNPAWNRAYFEVYGGPDYVSRRFSDTNVNFAQMRRESTSFKYAYSVGFRYGRVFNNGLMLKTGLNYSLLTEKFDFIQGNIINIIYVTDAAGDTIGSYQSTSARHKITYNKYRTVDVPLLAGYEMQKGRWNFSFSGGLVINLYSWNRGEVLDRSLQPVTINSGETPNPYQLKTNIGMGLQAGAGVYYGVGQKMKLFAEPYFRYNLSSMTQSEIILKQRFHTAGIRMGLRFDFNKK